MNAPVTTALPAARPAAPRASDTGSAHSAAPFSTALDGALHESRPSDRGVDRRSTPEDRAARADDRADAKDRRIDEPGRAADRRAIDKADRAEARADRRAARAAAEKAAHAATDAPATDAAEGTAPDDVAPETDETTDAGKSAEAPRGGLPALWALVMGGSLATPPVEDAAADAGTAVPSPPPAVPAVDTTGVPAAAAPGVPTADPTAPTTTAAPVVGGGATETAASVTTPSAAAGTAAPAPTAEGVPADFAAVLGETGAVVTVPAGQAARTGAPTAGDTPAVPTPPVTPAADATAAAVPTETPVVALPTAPAAPAIEGDPEAGTAAPASADPVVPPVGSAAGETLSGDAGGAGQSSADDAPPAPATPAQSTLAPATSVVSPTVAAVADVDGATGAAATLPVGAQVARQVAVLGGGPDGAHSMTLVLTPETLGEVQVQVTLNKGSIELALRGAHEHGRAALLDALPELRRELEAAGLNPSRVEVSRDTGGSWLDRQPTPQQGFGDRGGQHDRGENRSRPWGRPADIAGSGPSLNPNRSTSSGVDVRV